MSETAVPHPLPLLSRLGRAAVATSSCAEMCEEQKQTSTKKNNDEEEEGEGEGDEDENENKK